MAWLHKFHRIRKRAGPPSFPPDRPMKMVLVGDSGVGKSRIYCRLHHHGEAISDSERHADSAAHTLQFTVAGEEWHVDLHDTMSTEDFDRLRPLEYPCTDLFVAVMSVVDQKSARNIVNKWVPEIHHHCHTIPFIILGTKTDLLEHTSPNEAGSQQDEPQSQRNGPQSTPNESKFSLKTLFRKKPKEDAFSFDETTTWTMEKGRKLAKMTNALGYIEKNSTESIEVALMEILEAYRHHEMNRIVHCK